MIDLTISIVSFNTKELLKNCIDSIIKNTSGLSYEIIVVDNASKDGSAQMVENNFPSVKLIKNANNLFFAKANNQATQLANGKYICLLNSDTIIPTNTFEYLISKIKNDPKIGAVGCKLVDDNNNIQDTLYRKVTLLNVLSLSRYLSRFFKSYVSNRNYQQIKYKTEGYVEVMQDSLIILSTEFVRNNRIYYDKLKLYCTEDQIAYEIEKSGLLMFYTPHVHAIHLLSKSTQPEKRPIFIYKINRSDNFYFFWKYKGLAQAILIYLFLSIDILLIYFISLLKKIILHK